MVASKNALQQSFRVPFQTPVTGSHFQFHTLLLALYSYWLPFRSYSIDLPSPVDFPEFYALPLSHKLNQNRNATRKQDSLSSKDKCKKKEKQREREEKKKKTKETVSKRGKRK